MQVHERTERSAGGWDVFGWDWDNAFGRSKSIYCYYTENLLEDTDAVACDLLFRLTCAVLMTSSQSKAEVASVVRITYNDTTYLVDKSNGVVYSNNPEDPQELGTWSADDGVVLGDGGGGGGQAKPGYQDVAPKAGYQDVKGFLNPNIELETDVKAIKAKVVYDDVPLSQKKAGYEAMNPEWLDGQHKMLSIHPWFREKSLCDARDAVKELENGA